MKLQLKRLLSYLPSALPTGITEFENWADSIIELLPPGLDAVPRDDKKYVLASSIQHLGATKCRMPKNYFISVLHKAASSQVAGQVFVTIKENSDKARQAALEAQKLAEATANQEVASGQVQEAP